MSELTAEMRAALAAQLLKEVNDTANCFFIAHTEGKPNFMPPAGYTANACCCRKSERKHCPPTGKRDLRIQDFSGSWGAYQSTAIASALGGPDAQEKLGISNVSRTS